MMRTHTCGELRSAELNKEVILCGWVRNVRDKGGLLWVDLRDRYGITQLRLEESETKKSLIDLVRKLGREDVVRAHGRVIIRQSKNSGLPTGDIEIELSDLVLVNPSRLPPFLIEDSTDGGESLRLQYRYLDLRRPPMCSNLVLRHEVCRLVRSYLDNNGFLEIETPCLVRSTPEGARDFLVPSRLQPGRSFALPQSPQLFKQLFMVGGLDRYYQIVKCFRDEDLRSDRQPEFTQIDAEMSFVDQQDVMDIFEEMMRRLMQEIAGITLGPLPRITYQQAMSRYGTDSPDLRIPGQLFDLTALLKSTEFPPFRRAQTVVCLPISGACAPSRKDLDNLSGFLEEAYAIQVGLKWLKFEQDGTMKSSIDKFLNQKAREEIVTSTGAKASDWILMLEGESTKVLPAMGALRVRLGQNSIKPGYAALWVKDFPLFEPKGGEEGGLTSMHHPFTSPLPEDLDLLDSAPLRMLSNAYDMVINGVEVGGGSIRIHHSHLQEKVFGVLGLEKEEISEKFGFLIEALQYGAPPHGGIAFGLDRICQLLGGGSSIRDFIAFPKNSSGRDAMTGAPSFPSD